MIKEIRNVYENLNKEDKETIVGLTNGLSEKIMNALKEKEAEELKQAAKIKKQLEVAAAAKKKAEEAKKAQEEKLSPEKLQKAN